MSDLVMIRMVSQNAVYGYRGTMLKRLDDQGNPIDHEVPEDMAAELCDQIDSKFRRVDASGSVIENKHDIRRRKSEARERSARTTNTQRVVATTRELLAEPEPAVDDDGNLDDDAELAEVEAEEAKKPKPAQAAKPIVKKTVIVKKPAAPAEGSTEGGVEV